MVERPVIAVGGENLIDYVDREGDATAYAGGSPYNVAMALGRLDARVVYISPISTDAWGDMLADTLARSGVSLTGERRPEPTTMARVTIAEGIPTYKFERECTAERTITLPGLEAALPADARAIHTGSLTLTDGEDAAVWEDFCAAAFDRGILVSLDPNVRQSVIADIDGYRARIMRMCAKSHLIKLSDEDLEALFPGLSEDDAVSALRDIAMARVIVLTRGGNGTLAVMENERMKIPAHRVPTLADTVGAGDTFSAALLAGLAETGALSPTGLTTLGQDGLCSLLQRASTAAALNCTRAGCDPPTWVELEAALHHKA